MFALALLAITAFAGTASCGASDEDACRHYFEVFCEREATCNPHAFGIAYFEDVGTCVERLSLTCPDLVALPNTNFHADAVSTCSDALAALSCADWEGPLPDACLTALRGTLEDGDPCVSSFQCPSLACSIPANATGYYVCGTCAPLVAAGGACNKQSICDTGLHCSSGVCTPAKLFGEVCGNVDDCRAGLVCLDGSCAAPRALGDLCSNDHECNQADAQYCDSTTETCTAVPSSYWRGECVDVVDFQVIQAYCRAGFYCDINEAEANGHCEPRIADGDTCAGSLVDPCIPPATCVAGICQLPEIPACTSP